MGKAPENYTLENHQKRSVSKSLFTPLPGLHCIPRNVSLRRRKAPVAKRGDVGIAPYEIQTPYAA